MRKVLLLISFTVLAFSSTTLSAQTPNDKYGPNSAECLKYISYYEEYYKLWKDKKITAKKAAEILDIPLWAFYKKSP